jgi:hypothetical protein
MASRLTRMNPVTVNDVLDGHTCLEIDCVDRLYLSLSVPNLVVGGQVVSFLTQHERAPVPSPVLLDRRGQAFRRGVMSFAEANDIPVLSFAGKRDKRRLGVLADSPWPERKIDQVMPLMRRAAATGRSQVVAIGVAQEFQQVFTATKSEAGTSAVWFPITAPNAGSPATTSTSGTLTSARRSSRSAPTSLIRARSGSTGTSGPNGKPSRQGSAFVSCPTDSPPARTHKPYRTSATGSGPV